MNERIKEITEKVISKIESADLVPFEMAVFRGNNKPSDKWSIFNRVIMYVEGTLDARTFLQWKSVNRYVNKGARAFYILAPVTVKVKDEEDEDEEEIRLIGFKPVPVFSIENTTGVELPKGDFDNFKIPAQFDSIIKELGIKVNVDSFKNGAYGWYSVTSSAICLMTPEIEVFFHELSHAVDFTLFELKGAKEEKEFVAEFSAAIIAEALGYKISIENVKAYLKDYGYDDLKKSLSLIDRSLKVAEYIFNKTAKSEVEKMTKVSESGQRAVISGAAHMVQVATEGMRE